MRSFERAFDRWLDEPYEEDYKEDIDNLRDYYDLYLGDHDE